MKCATQQWRILLPQPGSKMYSSFKAGCLPFRKHKYLFLFGGTNFFYLHCFITDYEKNTYATTYTYFT